MHSIAIVRCGASLINERSLWYAEISPKSGNNSVVECDLAKVEVAGSNPVSRSTFAPVPGESGRAATRRSCEGGLDAPASYGWQASL